MRDKVAAIPGVSSVEVSAHSGRLVVTADDAGPVEDAAVIAAVEQAGYAATKS